MSHAVEVKIIADQFINILGQEINIHDLERIVLDGQGNIVEFTALNRPKE